MIISLNPF